MPRVRKEILFPSSRDINNDFQLNNFQLYEETAFKLSRKDVYPERELHTAHEMYLLCSTKNQENYIIQRDT